MRDMKTCPKCNLKILNNAVSCECGFRFETDLTTGNLDSTCEIAPQHDYCLDGKVVIRNPKAFAEWLLEYVVCAYSFEDDLSLAPSPDQCKRLKISDAERIACGNEYVLLRALAAILYMRKQQMVPTNYTTVFEEVLRSSVRVRMEKHAPTGNNPKVFAGISGYLNDFTNENPALPFCLTYLGRVYSNNPIVESMLTSEMVNIPLHVFKYVVEQMGLVQDAVLLLSGVQPAGS